MNIFWLASSAFSISWYWCELQAFSCGRTGAPSARGMLYRRIHARHTFCACSQPPR